MNHAQRYVAGVEIAHQVNDAIGSVSGTRTDKQKIAEMVVGRLAGEWRLIDRWAVATERSEEGNTDG